MKTQKQDTNALSSFVRLEEDGTVSIFGDPSKIYLRGGYSSSAGNCTTDLLPKVKNEKGKLVAQKLPANVEFATDGMKLSDVIGSSFAGRAATIKHNQMCKSIKQLEQFYSANGLTDKGEKKETPRVVSMLDAGVNPFKERVRRVKLSPEEEAERAIVALSPDAFQRLLEKHASKLKGAKK